MFFFSKFVLCFNTSYFHCFFGDTQNIFLVRFTFLIFYFAGYFFLSIRDPVLLTFKSFLHFPMFTLPHFYFIFYTLYLYLIIIIFYVNTSCFFFYV